MGGSWICNYGILGEFWAWGINGKLSGVYEPFLRPLKIVVRFLFRKVHEPMLSLEDMEIPKCWLLLKKNPC